MINYKSPPVELHPAPFGLDLVLQAMQARLAADLPWLQKSFGRATIATATPAQKGAGDKRPAAARDVIYPEGYYKQEPFSLMPNDNLDAYCFFVPKDPVKFLDYEPLTNDGAVAQPLAVIFWANMQKVNPNKKYNFSEELRRAALISLKRCTGFVVEESTTQYDKVFAPFTITEVFKQYSKLPYTAFRFDGTLNFDYLNC